MGKPGTLRPYLPSHRCEDAPLPRLPGWLARATDRVFAVVAALRSRRALHPRGAAFHGQLVTRPGGELPRPDVLLPGRRWPVLVRLSKGAGLPSGWPDVLGLAVRVVDAYGPDRHQDVLLSSSASPPLLRNLVLPALGFDRAVYSSVALYRSRGRRILLAATAERQRKPVTIDDATAAVPQLRFTLRMAAPLAAWEDVADVVLTGRLGEGEAERLDFDPWNTTPELRPVGLLNALRAPAYAGSRRARRAATVRLPHRPTGDRVSRAEGDNPPPPHSDGDLPEWPT